MPLPRRAPGAVLRLTLTATLTLTALGAEEPATPPVPLVQPWRTVALDPDYGGAWVVAGDLDGDGEVEIVCARNVDQNDVHYTSAVVAQRLDGGVLWRWGNPAVGRQKLHHDVACQIHDWDGDGRNEVILCHQDALVELDGVTGRERRRFPLPKDATDCLVFANLSGSRRPTDVLVKTRYTQIWAFNRDGQQLWTVEKPGGYLTAHQPVPVDLDGDGRDEVMAGYAMLNADGSVRWVFKAQQADQARGHADCFRQVRAGTTPGTSRFVLTMCGANAIAMPLAPQSVRTRRTSLRLSPRRTSRRQSRWPRFWSTLVDLNVHRIEPSALSMA